MARPGSSHFMPYGPYHAHIKRLTEIQRECVGRLWWANKPNSFAEETSLTREICQPLL